jgi:hypothetical protein
MKRSLIIISAVLVASLAVQCTVEVGDGGCSGSGHRVYGSGNVVRRDYSVSGISGVNLATIGTLYILFGDREELAIEAEDNLHEYFEAEVRRDILKIETRKNTNLRPKKPVKYYLTVKELDTIAISSSGDIEAPDIESGRFSVAVTSSGTLQMGDLDARSFSVTISSSGDVYVGDLKASDIDVAISSSGSLDIEGGAVEDQGISISSSGNYKAKRLKSETARVRLSSSGSAYLHVTDSLDVVISSSGSVYYVGNPAVRQVISSSGRIKQIGL